MVRGVAYAAVEAGNFSAAEMMEHRNFQPLVMRLAKMGIGKTFQHLVPGQIEIGGKPYKKLAAGGEQIVYSDGAQVVKFIHRSLTFDKETAEETTDSYDSGQQTVAFHMGEHQTPTEFDLRKLKAGLFATIAVQPYVHPIRRFEGVSELVEHAGDPLYMGALESFYASLMDLYANAGMQMDLNGPGNIVMVDKESTPLLTMVDTLPVDPEKQKIIDPIGQTTLGETLLGKMVMIGEAVSGITEWPESRVVALR